MGIRKKLLAVGVVGVVSLGLYAVATVHPQISEIEEKPVEEEPVRSQKDTVYLWYTDDTMTDYLNSAAVSFNETKEEVRVVPVLKAGVEYLENIHAASVEDRELPDLYIVGNDSLEKAYLSGLAAQISAPSGYDMDALFPDTAQNAVSYKGRIVGYPLSYVTSTLLYNKTYLRNWIAALVEAQADAEAGQEAQARADESSSDEELEQAAISTGETFRMTEEELEQAVEEYLPRSFENLMVLADEYEAPEQVEGILKWDVNDIFYNYFFIGDAISVGGTCGDDIHDIDLYNAYSIEGMIVYKSLNQFFSIDTEQTSYQSVVQDFVDGKIVFMIAKQDAVAQIEAAKEEGTFPYEYGALILPDVDSNVKAKSLSVTNAVVVNGYSVHKDTANEFAAYLTTQDGVTLYNRTGKVSALSGVSYENEVLSDFMAEYERSQPIAKMIETSNYWVNLEIAFARVWNGEDPNAILKELSEDIKTQVTGEKYEEEYIPVEEPKEEEEEAEEELSDGSGEQTEE